LPLPTSSADLFPLSHLVLVVAVRFVLCRALITSTELPRLTAPLSTLPCPREQKNPGTDLAPTSLISAGLISQLESLNWQVSHSPAQHPSFTSMTSAEDPPIGNMHRPRSVSRVCEEVKNQVGAACAKGELPVVLGGDHSLAMGTIAGSMSKYPDACVIWVSCNNSSFERYRRCL
jgi:arginase